MNYPHPLLAREGWPFLIVLFAVAVICSLLGLKILTALVGVALLFTLQFFRDPPRVIAGVESFDIVSPADGRVIAIEECDDPWLSRRALKISVFMNVFNVHSNRSPIDGEVKKITYHPGRFFNAALAKASVENERCAMHLVGEGGQDVTCVQVAGLVARRILNYMEPGKKLARGDRYGFIRFGSRVDLYLPLDVQVVVTIGDKVLASSTLMAKFAKASNA